MSWRSTSFIRQLLVIFVTVTSILATSSKAQAFCGFFASKTADVLYNDATQVVLMRHGTQTVLSMRNTYQGPPEDFAMVVPVPQVLEQKDVEVLSDNIFDALERRSSPRLVEHWQQGRCGKKPRLGLDPLAGDLTSIAPAQTSAVSVAGNFEVGEYDILILSAKESNELEKWLLTNGYNIPKGATKVLAPYIAQGMYFFVAKINVNKVTPDDKGNVMLPPLRFHYDSKDFSLPVRLGLLNAKGPQDLIVHIFSVDGRYRVANYPNLTIPTDIEVPAKARDNFADFYDELFEYVLSLAPGAIVTEYAWSDQACSGCVASPIQSYNLHSFGFDVLRPLGQVEQQATVSVRNTHVMSGASHKLGNALYMELQKKRGAMLSCYEDFLATSPKRKSGEIRVLAEFTDKGTTKDVLFIDNSLQNIRLEACLEAIYASFTFDPVEDATNHRYEFTLSLEHKVAEQLYKLTSQGWTLTRLHARYTEKTMTEDLIFEQAPPIRGGIGIPRGEHGQLAPRGLTRSANNSFQGLYTILHRDEAKLACKKEAPSWEWRSRSNERGHSKTPSKKTKYKLSKDVQKQVRAQIKAQEDIE